MLVYNSPAGVLVPVRSHGEPEPAVRLAAVDGGRVGVETEPGRGAGQQQHQPSHLSSPHSAGAANGGGEVEEGWLSSHIYLCHSMRMQWSHLVRVSPASRPRSPQQARSQLTAQRKYRAAAGGQLLRAASDGGKLNRVAGLGAASLLATTRPHISSGWC